MTADKTADATADTPTDTQADAAVSDVAPHIEALTTLLSNAADTIEKRSLEGHPHHKADIFALVSKLIYEILCTVKKLLFKIGLGKSRAGKRMRVVRTTNG
jgi:hypothetical protein